MAPYVDINYNAVEFFGQIDRLANDSPAEISAVLKVVLNSHTPVSDFKDQLKSLLMKIDAIGLHDDAMFYANQLRNIPEMRKLFDQLALGG